MADLASTAPHGSHDDGDSRRAQRVEDPAIPEHWGHIRNGKQRGREPWVVPREHLNSHSVRALASGLRTVLERAGFFEQDRVVRAEAVGETNAGQVGYER